MGSGDRELEPYTSREHETGRLWERRMCVAHPSTTGRQAGGHGQEWFRNHSDTTQTERLK